MTLFWSCIVGALVGSHIVLFVLFIRFRNHCSERVYYLESWVLDVSCQCDGLSDALEDHILTTPDHDFVSLEGGDQDA